MKDVRLAVWAPERTGIACRAVSAVMMSVIGVVTLGAVTQPPTFRTEANVVSMSVTITDAAGRWIPEQLPASGFDRYPFGGSEIEEIARISRLLESWEGVTRAGATLVAQAVPPPDQFATVNGVRLHFLDWGGHGPAIVFLAGLGDSVHRFDALAAKLADRYHALGFTRRGQETLREANGRVRFGYAGR